MEVKQLAAAIKTKHVFGTDCVPQVSPTKTLFLWLNVENMRGDQKLYSCFFGYREDRGFQMTFGAYQIKIS